MRPSGLAMSLKISAFDSLDVFLVILKDVENMRNKEIVL
jgi:hypothetical protein